MKVKFVLDPENDVLPGGKRRKDRSPLSEEIDWADVLTQRDTTDANKDTILVFDSYYTDRKGVSELSGRGVKVIAAVQTTRFPDLHAAYRVLTEDVVQRPGDWEGIHNSAEDLTYLNHWSAKKGLGNKYVLSNAFKMVRKPTPVADRYVIPVYDHYGKYFSICDHFNRALNDRKFPHKCGGNGRPGDLGHQHKFAMACILQNTFNTFVNIHNVELSNYNFREYCLALADELYQHALTFPKHYEAV